MLAQQKLFWLIVFFLCGVGLAGLLDENSQRMLLVFLSVAGVFTYCVLAQKQVFAILSLMMLVGAGYYGLFEPGNHTLASLPEDELTYSGLVTNVIRYENSQQADLQLHPPFKGKVRASLSRYPEVRYGDVLSLTGTLQAVPDQSRRYYQKEGISALIKYPKDFAIIARDQGSPVKSALVSLRTQLRGKLEALLSPEQAGLLDGLLLGKSSGLSRELSEKLQKTGTTHIVALSGYNVALVANGIFILLARLWIPRHYSFYITILVLCAFVIMTGAEASVVRAALMAGIVFLGQHVGRPHTMHHSIALAALAMVLFNPQVLVFDLGFQLSFLALFGIVYLKPAAHALLHISTDPGFLGWREILVTTCCAQVAVLPLLLATFGTFPLFSILTNVLLLIAVPWTTLLGFLLLFLSFISPFIAQVAALPLKVLLGYELSVINFFSQFDFQITWTPSIVFAAVYYATLILLLLYGKRRAAEVF